ncbi:hypothetical protein [Candidatus Poriferisodalis sp.]|uniref:hypothetical protein n=1 Tax=Candidatus Poriferisodalis sp. TaxID=3101277 RepID=UPI003B527880
MSDYVYVLSACWADRGELLDHGTLSGENPVGLTKQQLALYTDPGVDRDVFALVRGRTGANDEISWRLEAMDIDALLVSNESDTGGPFGTGSTQIQIPCRTYCPDHPHTAAPEVRLTATFFPTPTSAPKQPPTTRIGALLRQFSVDSVRR